MNKEVYNAYNNSFKRKVIFRIGYDSGFFSEYNNMIFAIYYSLINNLQFILYSKNANFSFDQGWSDYFMAFTKEDRFLLNNIFNARYSKPQISGIKMKFRYLFFKTYLSVKNIDFLTYDIFYKWNKLNIKDIRQIPEIGLQGNLIENCKVLNHFIWRYNDVVKSEINTIISNNIPKEPFISFHIRRGDKSKEVDFVELDIYIKMAMKYDDNLKTVFVATDDYTVYEQLCNSYKNWKFITLTTPDNRGYDQNSFDKVSPSAKRDEMIQLFASIEIMSRSDIFFGTLSSNIGLYMYWRMPEGKCVGVDYNEWKIW